MNDKDTVELIVIIGFIVGYFLVVILTDKIKKEDD